MKGHKSDHHKRDTGGRNLAADDLDEKTEMRVNAPKIDREANEKKRGGRTKRKSGGMVHHEKMENMKHAKHIGKVHGEEAKHHAGRKPRKDGGRTGADSHPFSSARNSDPAPGRKVQTEFEGANEA